ncbi:MULTISPECIES: hypothetical protein [Dermacoccus]|uniref:Uncharacterized protein n=1 Tax=Dermacoccus profundi TaxID=322602 RepID=A0ABN2CR70_9MICO|nr:hypothetical protein [Dermacoccus abyssi]
MSATLSVLCDMFARLQPFAIMAFVPLLMWVWHFETTPAHDEARKGVCSSDTLDDEVLEGWAA